ncbi:spermatogenesis-associated protein 2-like protein isoform X1 [Lates japonicus]|uniref:Spermatogenesis-associated protein 2-like protein isoform X1 n=1 Tax=Lates japonicus TaxID=270547 RepID=A0AAD3NA93_LATJO|nr:spermatogenesis-associated protein 2-like protein isoform X1 [Lates japonicus]
MEMLRHCLGLDPLRGDGESLKAPPSTTAASGGQVKTRGGCRAWLKAFEVLEQAALNLYLSPWRNEVQSSQVLDVPGVSHSQPLSIEIHGGLVFASAQTYAIRENKGTGQGHFDRSLPDAQRMSRWLIPIFVLRAIIQNQHEMFLMRKNNLDFELWHKLLL